MILVFLADFSHGQTLVQKNPKPRTNEIKSTQPITSNDITCANTLQDHCGNKTGYGDWNTNNILTAFLTLFTLVLAYFGWKQFALAEATSEKQLRAYISLVFNNLIEQDISLDRNYEFHCHIQNTGQTPAYKVVVNAMVGVMPIPYPENFNFELGQVNNPSITVIGPQQSTTIYPSVMGPPYDLAVIHEIKNPGGRRLCLYGRVDYKDVFGHPRFTNFSYYVIWGDKGAPSLMSTTQHNDAT
ncbi:MAG TPA: hypothetical protein VK791_05690 [bacterium]|jgi:hypothetical protein|nr:hypothetical protein [bacterium]